MGQFNSSLPSVNSSHEITLDKFVRVNTIIMYLRMTPTLWKLLHGIDLISSSSSSFFKNNARECFNGFRYHYFIIEIFSKLK